MLWTKTNLLKQWIFDLHSWFCQIVTQNLHKTDRGDTNNELYSWLACGCDLGSWKRLDKYLNLFQRLETFDCRFPVSSNVVNLTIKLWRIRKTYIPNSVAAKTEVCSPSGYHRLYDIAEVDKEKCNCIRIYECHQLSTSNKTRNNYKSSNTTQLLWPILLFFTKF